MTSSAQYDANGNRLLSVTDNAGATVEYGYSGELSKMLALPGKRHGRFGEHHS